MSKRNILVTGATGFLGGALVRRLAALGHRMTALGRNRTKAHAFEQTGIAFKTVDMTDRQAVLESCRGQDVVFHCAALSAPWGTYRAFERANVFGTQNLVDACRANHVARLIHVSTPSVYFDFTDRLNISEDRPLPERSCNHYAKTKRMAEEIVQNACNHGLRSVILRPRAIFGPGDTTLFPRIIRANRAMGIPLIDDGRAVVDITYVDNVVDALLACLNAPPEADGHVFNISNGEPLSVVDLLTQLFTAQGEAPRFRPLTYGQAMGLATTLERLSQVLTLGRMEPPVTRYGVGVLAKSQTLDISAARGILGYQPTVSVAEGLKRFADWWKGRRT